jgi:uncharacterized membrane protein (DUF373 family)
MSNMPAAANTAVTQLFHWFDALAGNPLAAKLGFAAAFVLLLVLLARNALERKRPMLPAPPRRHALAPPYLSRPEDPDDKLDDEQVEELTLMGTVANRIFLQFETIAYIVLGLLLAATIVLGITGSAITVWGSAFGPSNETTLVYSIDRMLFLLMVVEILRTVRDSFRSGKLVSEPFLIVGLIASIRRVLVITLESSQVSRAGVWTPASQGPFNASMEELIVLGALILIMVVCIFLLRMSRRYRHAR